MGWSERIAKACLFIRLMHPDRSKASWLRNWNVNLDSTRCWHYENGCDSVEGKELVIAICTIWEPMGIATGAYVVFFCLKTSSLLMSHQRHGFICSRRSWHALRKCKRSCPGVLQKLRANSKITSTWFYCSNRLVGFALFSSFANFIFSFVVLEWSFNSVVKLGTKINQEFLDSL